MNIYDIINRARSLKEEYRLDSVTPERLGALHEDTLKYINEYQLLASSPAIHKTYASISAMQSSSSPKSDLTGKPLKAGQLVVIVPADPSDSTAGDVYRYDGPSGNTSKWTFVAKIGAVPADAELSATSTNPPQNQAVTAKLTELESEVYDKYADIPTIKFITSNLVQALELGASAGDTILRTGASGRSLEYMSIINEDATGFSYTISLDEKKLFRIDNYLATKDIEGFWKIILPSTSIPLSKIDGKPTTSGTFGFDSVSGKVWYRVQNSASFTPLSQVRVGKVEMVAGAKLHYGKKTYTIEDGQLILESDITAIEDGLSKKLDAVTFEEEKKSLDTFKAETDEKLSKKAEKESLEKVSSSLSVLTKESQSIIASVKTLNRENNYIFKGDSYVQLSEPIILQQDGDSIELGLSDIPSSDMVGVGQGFTLAGDHATLWRGIGVLQKNIRVRLDDGTWAALDAQRVNAIPTMILKISYENGNIVTYADGVAVNTYEGQGSLTIKRFGQGLDGVYWNGRINYIKVNDSFYDLGEKGIFYNMGNDASFLRQSEKEVLYGKEEMYVEKTAGLLTVYVRRPNGGYIGYPLTYNLNTQSGVFCDQWGMKKVFSASLVNGQMINNGNLFYNSEAELAMKLSIEGSSVFVGGVMHGYENIVGGTQAGGDGTAREITFIVDNEKVAEDSVISLKPCKMIDVIQHTYLYPHDKNASPFADVVKAWKFSKDGLDITTKMNVNKEMTFLNCYFGMFGVLRRWGGSSANPYLVNSIIKNDEPYRVFDVSDGWSNFPLSSIDKACTKMTAYGEMGYGFSIEIENSNIDIAGMMCSHNNNPYNKLYYGFATDANPLNFSGEWHATQKWRIL